MVTLSDLPGVAITIAVAAVGLTLVIRVFLSPLQKIKRPGNCNFCMSSWCSAFCLLLLSLTYCFALQPFTVSGAAWGVAIIGIASAAAIPLATRILKILAAEKEGAQP